jgi:hypothetical protein
LDTSGYEREWARLFVGLPPPRIDFERELVVFANLVVSASCPHWVQIGVETEDDRHLVYGRFAQSAGQVNCSDAAVPNSFAYAIRLNALPSGPVRFRLQQSFQICPECEPCADCEREREQKDVVLP